VEGARGEAGAFCGVVGVGLAIGDVPVAAVSVCLLVRRPARVGWLGGRDGEERNVQVCSIPPHWRLRKWLLDDAPVREGVGGEEWLLSDRVLGRGACCCTYVRKCPWMLSIETRPPCGCL